MIAIIDYGVGNLFSLESSFGYIGKEAELTSDVEKIRAADRLILPGVGAFADAAKKLRESGLAEVVIDEARSGKPLLGICLGMQLVHRYYRMRNIVAEMGIEGPVDEAILHLFYEKGIGKGSSGRRTS